MPRPKVSFYTSGERVSHLSSYIIINQCYVQHVRAVPTETRPCPILFIHGGGLTGAQWEATPDRRPGWAMHACEAGFPVYVLDAVDHGRSQAAPDALRKGPVEHRTAGQVWEWFRFGKNGGLEKKEVFEGSMAVVDAFDVLVGSQAQRRRTTDDVETRGIVEAIKEIGECFVVAHSHGAALIMDGLTEVEQLVNKLVLVEPGGTAVPSKLLKSIPTLVVWGDFIKHDQRWIRIQSPYLQSHAEMLLLPEVGIRGNTHFPMLDQNSQVVFNRILDWLNG